MMTHRPEGVATSGDRDRSTPRRVSSERSARSVGSAARGWQSVTSWPSATTASAIVVAAPPGTQLPRAPGESLSTDTDDDPGDAPHEGKILDLNYEWE